MTSLFSSFDLFFFKFSLVMFMIMISMLINYTYKLNYLNTFMNKIFMFFSVFFLSIKDGPFNKLMMTIFISIMVLIFMFNMSSVLSFNFSFTSQMSIVMFFSLMFWLSFIIFQLIMNMKGFLSHCIPEGTPIYLTWFLFIIEMVSNMIRPITLTVRLVANILAGHLLMILLSKLSISSFFLNIPYMALNMVEMFVSLIQAYIFVTMITLYYSELN